MANILFYFRLTTLYIPSLQAHPLIVLIIFVFYPQKKEEKRVGELSDANSRLEDQLHQEKRDKEELERSMK